MARWSVSGSTEPIFSAMTPTTFSRRSSRPSPKASGTSRRPSRAARSADGGRTITRNKLANHFRCREIEPRAAGGSEAARRIEQAEEPARDFDAAEEEALKELRQRVMKLIEGEFEPRTWEMFWRVTVREEAVKDVATEMGVTPGAVRVAKSRVLQRLREELEGLEEI